MSKPDQLQFLLDREYVAETFEDLFTGQENGVRELTATERQQIALLFLAVLPEDHSEYTHATISQRDTKFLVTLTRS